MAISKQIEKDEKKLGDLQRSKDSSEKDLESAQNQIEQLMKDQEVKEKELEEIQSSIQCKLNSFIIY